MEQASFDPTDLVGLGTEELARQLIEAHKTIESLTAALKSSRTIGAAMGILVEREHLDKASAFERLREASMRCNRKLRDVAEQFVLTGELAGDDEERSA